MTDVARTGRPSRIFDRMPVHREGQPAGDESIIDTLTRAVRAGATVEDACGTIHPPLHKATWMNWQKRGRLQRERLDAASEDGTDYQVPELEAPFLDFFDRLQVAEHQAKVEALVAIREAIVGYDEVETIITEVETPTTITNRDGVQEVVMATKRTTTTKRSRRKYWAAAMTWLERRYGTEYAKRMLDVLDGEPDPERDQLLERARLLVDEVGLRREQRALAQQIHDEVIGGDLDGDGAIDVDSRPHTNGSSG